MSTPNRKLYHCPYAGCNQTSTRRWNMQIHIKRRHNDGSWSVTAGNQPSFSLNQRGASEQSSQYMYGPPYRLNTTADEGKSAKSMLDKNLETLLRIIEIKRLSIESERTFTANSVVSENAKFLMIQMFSNFFPDNRRMSTKKEIFPTGYRISFCDACLLGCKLEPVFYPIEFEWATKLKHQCDTKNLFAVQNKEQSLEKKRNIKGFLEDYLSKVVLSRIGQGNAYLKAVMLSGDAFSEERRRNLKIPADRSLIEECDCIKIDLPCDRESMDNYWFCRTIREVDKKSVKISQNELAEFISVAKSTFGVFVDIVRKDYFLIYLLF
jgi:hypothetical protein